MEGSKGKVSHGIWRTEGKLEGWKGPGGRGQAMQSFDCQAAELRPSPESPGESQQATDKSDFAFKGG